MAPSPDMTLPVFLMDALPSAPRITLAGDEARHAAAVRRIRVGERLVVSDGAGSAARCAVATVLPGRDAVLELDVEDRWTEPAPALRVVVAQALAKGDRGELAVELATEAGADEIVPWRAERSIAQWDAGIRTVRGLARWRATARAAAKQSRRLRLPTIDDPIDTARLAERARRSTMTLVLDGDGEYAISEIDLPLSGELIVVVGPEGGITRSELDTLVAAGAKTTRLGPFVLRTSTAGAVALAAIGALTERWK